MEFGKRDHFMKTRRRRYALYGDPEDGNFTDFTIATEKSSKAELDAYNWWCSIPYNDDENRYDFYNYPSSFYKQRGNETNYIGKKNRTAKFKFKTSFEQNEHY